MSMRQRHECIPPPFLQKTALHIEIFCPIQSSFLLIEIIAFDKNQLKLSFFYSLGSSYFRILTLNFDRY